MTSLFEPPGGGRTLLIDPTFGVAGDMLLAALVDAGADTEFITHCVEAVLPGTVGLRFTRASRGGLAGTKLDVELRIEDQPHRAWAEIRELLHRAELPTRVREQALSVFGALAEAEAEVHGTNAADVHFHEVGAWDSIADVVGVVAALSSLEIEAVLTLPVSVGAGTVRAAHGLLPVPPPAVAALIAASSLPWRGLPPGADADRGEVGELATPTGVAVLAALAKPVGAAPASVTYAMGVGIGTKEFEEWPNALRVTLLEPVETPKPQGAPFTERGLSVLETNVDDVDPRVWPSVYDHVLGLGALDVWSTEALGKKGRPARMLSVLVDPADVSVTDMALLICRHTGSLGVRERRVGRWALDRGWREVPLSEWPGERVRVKFGVAGGQVVHATPEYEDCAAVAGRVGVPVLQVLEAGRAAAQTAGLIPGASPPE